MRTTPISETFYLVLVAKPGTGRYYPTGEDYPTADDAVSDATDYTEHDFLIWRCDPDECARDITVESVQEYNRKYKHDVFPTVADRVGFEEEAEREAREWREHIETERRRRAWA